MHAATIIAPLALAASVSAVAQPQPAVTKFELAARQATSTLASSACLETLGSLILAIPSPSNSDVASFVGTALPLESIASAIKKDPKIKDVDLFCTAMAAQVTPPATLSADYASYTSEISVWHSSWAPIASKIAPQCGKEIGPTLELMVAQDAAQCKAAINKLSSGASGVSRLNYMAAAAAVAGAAFVFVL